MGSLQDPLCSSILCPEYHQQHGQPPAQSATRKNPIKEHSLLPLPPVNVRRRPRERRELQKGIHPGGGTEVSGAACGAAVDDRAKQRAGSTKNCLAKELWKTTKGSHRKRTHSGSRFLLFCFHILYSGSEHAVSSTPSPGHPALLRGFQWDRNGDGD